MAQTSYTTRPTIAFEGMVADWGPKDYSYGRDDTNSLHFGRIVIHGATDSEVLHPAGTAGTPKGLVAHSHDMESFDATNDVPIGHIVNILRKGRIWVIPETDVVPGNPVYYRHANAGAAPEALGRLRDDDDGSSGDVTLLEGAVWRSTALAGTPALVEINFP